MYFEHLLNCRVHGNGVTVTRKNQIKNCSCFVFLLFCRRLKLDSSVFPPIFAASRNANVHKWPKMMNFSSYSLGIFELLFLSLITVKVGFNEHQGASKFCFLHPEFSVTTLTWNELSLLTDFFLSQDQKWTGTIEENMS